jgi:cysteine desulfurase
VHLLALSGHKLYAPKGIGALIVRKGIKVHPLSHGGSQERNRRAGTENVAGIVALGKACQLAQETLISQVKPLECLRARLEKGILEMVPGSRLNGHPQKRLPNTANISFPGTEADSLLVSLDLEGIAVSSGSACSSGTLKTSHVLAAMGIDPLLARSSVRFSLGRESTDTDVDCVLKVLPEIVARLRGNR